MGGLARRRNRGLGKASLPHCFNHYDACDPDLPYYRGHGWYRKRIPVLNPLKNGRTLLHFEGAGQTSNVHVGNTLVGTHVGGYDEFIFDITDAIAVAAAGNAGITGTNKDGVAISVLCDNSQDMERSPSDSERLQPVWRSLPPRSPPLCPRCLARGGAHFSNICAWFVCNRWGKGAPYNPTQFAGTTELSIQVKDAEGKAVHQSAKSIDAWKDEVEIASFIIESPALWSPSHPHLYTCSVTLTTDFGESAAKERFGIRHAEFVDNGPFKLNGERLLLRGTQRHMDHAEVAAAQPDEQLRQELELVKAMGANFIRLGHYQQPRVVLDLCDELGLLVWEEAPGAAPVW